MERKADATEDVSNNPFFTLSPPPIAVLAGWLAPRLCPLVAWLTHAQAGRLPCGAVSVCLARVRDVLPARTRFVYSRPTLSCIPPPSLWG